MFPDSPALQRLFALASHSWIRPDHLSIDPRGHDPRWVYALLRNWAHDQCHALTLALHAGTGWPICLMYRMNHVTRHGSVHHDIPVHSVVRTPDGGLLDAYGHDPEGWVRAPERMGATQPEDARWETLGLSDFIRRLGLRSLFLPSHLIGAQDDCILPWMLPATPPLREVWSPPMDWHQWLRDAGEDSSTEP